MEITLALNLSCGFSTIEGFYLRSCIIRESGFKCKSKHLCHSLLQIFHLNDIEDLNVHTL